MGSALRTGAATHAKSGKAVGEPQESPKPPRIPARWEFDSDESYNQALSQALGPNMSTSMRRDAMKHVLLLGNGAVGKSTIVSHIKSVFGQTEKEQNGALNAMLKALIQTTSLVCDILLDSEQEFNIPDGVFESMDTIANIASRGRCYVHMKGTPSTPDQKTEQQLLATCLKDVWTNADVKQVAKANHLSSLTTDLCVKHLDSIFLSGFQLDMDDFLQIQKSTTMMSKTTGS